jgi:hypothetical protein
MRLPKSIRTACLLTTLACGGLTLAGCEGGATEKTQAPDKEAAESQSKARAAYAKEQGPNVKLPPAGGTTPKK